jgi:hypothetical protein
VTERRRLVEEALDLVARPVHAAEALIDAVEKLRGTLERYDFLAPTWLSGKSVGTTPSSLKLMLVGQFGAVSSAARKLGGRRILRHVAELDETRTTALTLVDPPNDAGLPDAERERLRRVLDALRDAATIAAARRRRVRAVVVAVLVLAVGVGFVLGLVVDAAR